MVDKTGNTYILDYSESSDSSQVKNEKIFDVNEDELTEKAENIEVTENLPVPQAIIGHRNKLFLVSCAFFVASISICLYLKSYEPLILLLGTGYFAFQGVTVVSRFNNGYIREIPAICTGVKVSTIRDRMTVTFKTLLDDESDDGEEYFRFMNLPKRKSDEFSVDHPYIIYYDIDSPQTLIAYTDL